MIPLRNFILLGATLALGTGTLEAAVLTIELPHETASFKPGPGSELANGQCLTCHSVEYVTTQPPKPRAFWAAEVKKMRETFGAQVPEDQVEPIVDYMERNYGVQAANTTPPASATTRPVAASASGQTLDGQALAVRYGCLGCHNTETKLVGPAYKDVAAKYRQDPQAFSKIAEQIHHGGSGKWGPVLMPPFPTVSDAETRTLAQWILSQK